MKPLVFPLILLMLTVGCRPEAPVVENEPEKNPWEELNTEMGKVQEGIDQTLLKIRRLPSSDERDPEYARIVAMLILIGRFDKAIEVADLVRSPSIHDSLLRDIARNLGEKAMQQFLFDRPVNPTVSDNADVQHFLKQALGVAGGIRGPICRVEAFTDLASFRLEMDDAYGARTMLADEVDRLRTNADFPDEIPQALCHIARWQLRQEEKPRALALCKDAEQSLPGVPDAFARASCGFDLVNLYTLLEDGDAVKRTLAVIENAATKITTPTEKANVLLGLAEATLHPKLNEPGADAEQILLDVKKAVLEAVRFHKEKPESVSDVDLKASILTMSAEEFTERKNEILRKIAVFQLWNTPLEEVWETVLDIDPGPQQDEALSAAARMLFMTGAVEDALAWAAEMTDPLKKQAILNEIERKKP